MCFQIMLVGPKLDLQRGHMLYIGLYRENMIKSACKKSQVLEL